MKPPWIPFDFVLSPLSAAYQTVTHSLLFLKLYFASVIRLCFVESNSPTTYTRYISVAFEQTHRRLIMKFSLVALATLIGAAVADLDPIVIKVLSPYAREDGVYRTNYRTRAPNSSTPAMILNCKSPPWKHHRTLLTGIATCVVSLTNVGNRYRLFDDSTDFHRNR